MSSISPSGNAPPLAVTKPTPIEEAKFGDPGFKTGFTTAKVFSSSTSSQQTLLLQNLKRQAHAFLGPNIKEEDVSDFWNKPIDGTSTAFSSEKDESKIFLFASSHNNEKDQFITCQIDSRVSDLKGAVLVQILFVSEALLWCRNRLGPSK